MAESMSPKEAWDTFVGTDVTVTDFLDQISQSEPSRGIGIEQHIGRYLEERGSSGSARVEAGRLIAEYISQTKQPGA